MLQAEKRCKTQQMQNKSAPCRFGVLPVAVTGLYCVLLFACSSCRVLRGFSVLHHDPLVEPCVCEFASFPCLQPTGAHSTVLCCVLALVGHRILGMNREKRHMRVNCPLDIGGWEHSRWRLICCVLCWQVQLNSSGGWTTRRSFLLLFCKLKSNLFT